MCTPHTANTRTQQCQSLPCGEAPQVQRDMRAIGSTSGTGYLSIPQHRAEVEQIFRLGVVPAMSFAGGALDVSFALGALRIFGHFYGLPGDQVYDYMYEDCRHVLLNLDSSLSARGRLALRPVLDLLTALHVGDTEPVGTGVLRGGALGAYSYQEWLQMYPQDHVKLLRGLPNLMLLSRSGGPYERAVHFLRDLLQRGFEDRSGVHSQVGRAHI